MITNIKHSNILTILLLSISTWLIYFNSLQVPFYFDDIRSISNNQILQTGSFLEIAKAHGMRAVAYLSFALDYKVSGDISQFHVSNILVHMLNGLLMYGLFWLLIFKTPNGPANGQINNKPNSQLNDAIKFIPLLGALLFIVHPLNSQAVTYIVQRSASLAALFYLAALCFYLVMRVQPRVIVKVSAIIGFVLCFSFALFTKQNTVTLPLVIIALELIVFNRLRVKHLGIATTLVAVAALIVYLLNPEWFISTIITIDAKTRENQVYTRLDYFLAQLSILWVYIAKFIAPYPLRLEYPYQITDFPLLQTVFAGLSHLALLCLAIIYRKRATLVCFGLVFYYLAHLVESGLIPIMDIAVEHRTYLPNVGLVLAVMGAAILVIEKLSRTREVQLRTILITSVIILIVYASITINRNKLWQNPIAFYQHELSLYPDSCRILNNLANQYIKHNRKAEGYALIEQCVKLNNGTLINGEEINNYVAILISQKKYDYAEKTALDALKTQKVRSNAVASRRIYENLGMMMMQRNKPIQAEYYLLKAIALPNPTLQAYLGLSVALAQQGKFKASNKHTNKILSIEPEHKAALDMKKRLSPYLNK